MSVWARTMFRVLSTVIGAIALLAPATQLHAGEAVTRSFHMGFTPAEYDVTSAARADLYAFIGRHADLIAHHFAEGVPWPEAFERRPYQASFEENLRYRVQQLTGRQRVFLYLTPLADDGLAGYRGADGNMPRPGRWRDKDLDDPEVITAYTNFCRDMIRRFHPDFMAYGLEVNGLIKKAPRKWPKFLTLARQVYTALKAEHPTLPVFVSLQLDWFWADPVNQRDSILGILPYSDYLAASTYPYVERDPDPGKLPKDYFARFAALAPNKPFAIAETGFAARDVHLFGATIPGREAWQDEYMKRLLAENQRFHAKFVVWFVPRDYDRFVEHARRVGVPDGVIQLLHVWESNGLVDAAGRPRQAFRTWSDWLRLPKR